MGFKIGIRSECGACRVAGRFQLERKERDDGRKQQKLCVGFAEQKQTGSRLEATTTEEEVRAN